MFTEDDQYKEKSGKTVRIEGDRVWMRDKNNIWPEVERAVSWGDARQQLYSHWPIQLWPIYGWHRLKLVQTSASIINSNIENQIVAANLKQIRFEISQLDLFFSIFRPSFDVQTPMPAHV